MAGDGDRGEGEILAKSLSSRTEDEQHVRVTGDAHVLSAAFGYVTQHVRFWPSVWRSSDRLKGSSQVL